MPHYQVPNDPNPHWLDSDKHESFLPVGYVQITDAEADAMRGAQLLASKAAMTYVENRAAAFPSVVDQLDYIYHNGVEAWKRDMIAPVKNKFPKV